MGAIRWILSSIYAVIILIVFVAVVAFVALAGTVLAGLALAGVVVALVVVAIKELLDDASLRRRRNKAARQSP